MNFSIDPKTLGLVAKALKSIPDGKNQIPICGMYLLDPQAGKLGVTATDLDIEATVTVDCAGVAPGEAVALPPFLLDAAAGLSASEVNVAIDERQAVFKAGRSRFAAPILAGSDFPRLAPDNATSADIAGKDIARLIDATIAAVAIEEARYYLKGVFLQVAEGRLHAVATHGHAIHAISMAAPAGLAMGKGIIVPTKAARAIAEIGRAAGEDPVRIEAGETGITIAAAGSRLAAKLIDGTYPAWDRVLGSPTGVTATVDIAELLAALDRVMKIGAVNEEKKKAELRKGAIRLCNDGEFLTISADGMSAEATDAVRAEFNGGEWGEHGVAGKYLRATLDTMRGLGAETAIIDIAQDRMRIENAVDDDFTAVIMLIRL